MVDAATQKAYKKAKKKRARIKQAERKKEMEHVEGVVTNKNPTSPANTQWRRVGPGDAGCHPKATDRPVDDTKINELLEQRSKAKLDKKYTVSDEITKTLIDMEIVYDDAKKQWHTRKLATVAQKAKKEQARKRENDNKAEPKGEPSAKKRKK